MGFKGIPLNTWPFLLQSYKLTLFWFESGNANCNLTPLTYQIPKPTVKYFSQKKITDTRKYIFDKELVNWLKKLLKNTKKKFNDQENISKRIMWKWKKN